MIGFVLRNHRGRQRPASFDRQAVLLGQATDIAIPLGVTQRPQSATNGREASWMEFPERRTELGRIDPRFARSEPRERFCEYVAGLVSGLQRKNSWWDEAALAVLNVLNSQMKARNPAGDINPRVSIQRPEGRWRYHRWRSRHRRAIGAAQR